MKEIAREAILARIRKGLRSSSGSGPVLPQVGGGGTGFSIGRQDAIPSKEGGGAIPREYRRVGSASRREVLELFAERVSDYRATVVRVSPPDLPRAVADALNSRGARRLVVPPELPDFWLEGVPDGYLEVLADGEAGEALSKEELASCHGVLTGCALGIAETGTIVLDSGPAQGRRVLTLLPDYHLCVVFEEQVVETVPEAVAVMGAGVVEHSRPLTLVSGPSATSDIELVRVEGVHGPRTLEVILVAEAGPLTGPAFGELP